MSWCCCAVVLVLLGVTARGCYGAALPGSGTQAGAADTPSEAATPGTDGREGQVSRFTLHNFPGQRYTGWLLLGFSPPIARLFSTRNLIVGSGWSPCIALDRLPELFRSENVSWY